MRKTHHQLVVGALVAMGCSGRMAGPGADASRLPTGTGGVMASHAGQGGQGGGGAGGGANPYSGGTGGGSDQDAGVTTPLPLASVVRKVKDVLTGLAPDDSEMKAASDVAGLRGLISTWMETPQFQEKMMVFFANAYQQSSLTILDFQLQLRRRPGAFDLPYGIYGDDAFPQLLGNIKESFARTCLALIAEGKPLTDLLTTQRFMMTTALESLYLQIEMPYDIHTLRFKFNHGMRPPLEETLDPTSPNYMVFGYQPPGSTAGRTFAANCAGDATKVSEYPGNTYLFQVLLGAVPRDGTNNSAGLSGLGCMEHASRPYFTPKDLSDWHMVTITSAGANGTPLRAYDLPGIRAAGGTLVTRLPRVSFFSTPAFLAVWNTNDSNQHRVTANQALLAALGQGFTSADAAIPTPPSAIGLDGQHAVNGSVCYACHKSLDPMRQFWANFFNFNDQVNAKPGSEASFGFGDVQQNGRSLVDFGRFVSLVNDTQVAGQPVNRFALALTQHLCFFANSARCDESDPEMRRVAQVFQQTGYEFRALVRELFSSPLVTAASSTPTLRKGGVTISIARREQLCAALSNRLGRTNLCELAPPPVEGTTPMSRLAGAIPADAFSRGSEVPTTPADPNLFYRAASELLCEAIASKVVDAPAGSLFTSANVEAAIGDMVAKVMAMPPSDPQAGPARKALREHYDAALASGAKPTNALRSTFAAACQAPTSLGIGM